MPPPTEKKLPPVESDPLDILPKQILRAPPAPPAPRWPAVSASPFLLLGLVSATQSRRDALRCTWVKALMAEDMGGAARVKFVVGEGALDTARADVLAVPVAEQMLVRKLKGGARKRIRGVSSYSTYSLYLKTIHFMRYAATQREPAVLLGDDDIFVQPHALLFYVWALLQASKDPSTPFGGAAAADGQGHWYAGRFDWYSWRTETLMATAYWRAMRGALYGAQEPFRNCSPTGAGWVYAADGKLPALREADRPNPNAERCVGPFAFAKGPLLLLSMPALRWVLASDGFARDVEQAARLANGTKPYGRATERVPQDVQLGYWLSQHPSLRYVSLPRKTGWADAFVEVTDLRRLLVGHRIPWDQLAWLTGRTERLWRAASHSRLHLRCAGAPCPVGQCAHARGQVSCAAELLLPPPLPRLAASCAGCTCWEGPTAEDLPTEKYAFSPGWRVHELHRTLVMQRGASGGSCNFTRTAAPELPAHCWDGGPLLDSPL